MLTAIAKRSGKLLKGGEPDQEAAAKMVLNDWIRGKIPYFVAPPVKVVEGAEEPVTAVEGETREVMEAQEKALGKILGEKRVKGVQQAVKGIITMPKFLGDDARREEIEEDLEGEEDEGMDEDSDDEDEEEDDDDEDMEAKEVDVDSDDSEELAWEDIFPGEAGPSMVAKALKAATGVAVEVEGEDEDEEEEDVEESEDDDEDDEGAASNKRKGEPPSPSYIPCVSTDFSAPASSDTESTTPKKDKRQTTNKKKAENFYTHAVSQSL
jgi:nuclear GTP-binding protein